MGRITMDMLRRRAEHNEGCLSTLEEVALHQQDIENIELVGDCCRQLQILYLCNNYIGRIEGLRHLKSLKYLNLAVNNVTRIEGLEGCESLERLDLTLNFIADLSTIGSLRANPFLETLHLTGNACCKVAGYRAYVVHTLPHLSNLDGDEIVKAERITARQCEDAVVEVVQEEVVLAREAERIKREMVAKGIDPFPAKFNEQGERVYGHTPEERMQMLREQQEMDEAKKKAQSEPAPGSISALHKELNEKRKPMTAEEELEKFGRLLLRNEGKVLFRIDQDQPEALVLTVEPGKFISTTLLDVQAEVNCIRVYVKGKLLQVPSDLELAPDAATVQRSTTTGQLKITVPYTPAVQESRRRGGVCARIAALDREEEEGADTAEKHRAAAAPAKTASPLPRDALIFPEDRAQMQPAASVSAAHQGKSLVTEVASRSSDGGEVETTHVTLTASLADLD